eukprot:242907_1
MGFSYPSSDDVLGLICTIVISSFILIFGVQEILKIQLSWGKFTDTGLVTIRCPGFLSLCNNRYSLKYSWFIVYLSSAIVYVCTTLIATHKLHDDRKWYHQHTAYFIASLVTFTVHFGKRCVEVLCIHIFSNKNVHFFTMYLIFAGYNCMAFSVAYGNTTNNLSDKELDDLTPIIIGWFIWLIGEFGNGYCHSVLVKLRKYKMEELRTTNHENAPYIELQELPKIFQVLIVPHYVFELIAWIGFTVIMREVNTLLALVAMMTLLIPRIYHTKQWYRSMGTAM